MGIESKSNVLPLKNAELAETDIKESGTLTTHAFYLNSANSVMHANAAKIGALYEKYRPGPMAVEWVPAVGTDSPGNVVLSYHASPQTTAPTSLQDALTASASLMDVIWKPRTLHFTPRVVQPWLQSRTGGNTAATGGYSPDNDFGVVYVTTLGAGTESIAGHVRFHYNYVLTDLVKDPLPPIP